MRVEDENAECEEDKGAIIEDISSQSSEDRYTFDDEDREEQKRQDEEIDIALIEAGVSTPARHDKTRNQDEDDQDSVLKQSIKSPCESVKKQEELRASKYFIPPPLPVSYPQRPRGAPPPSESYTYDEDPDKARFVRFLKMVERKKDASDKKSLLTQSQVEGRNTKTTFDSKDQSPLAEG